MTHSVVDILNSLFCPRFTSAMKNTLSEAVSARTSPHGGLRLTGPVCWSLEAVREGAGPPAWGISYWHGKMVALLLALLLAQIKRG